MAPVKPPEVCLGREGRVFQTNRYEEIPTHLFLGRMGHVSKTYRYEEIHTLSGYVCGFNILNRFRKRVPRVPCAPAGAFRPCRLAFRSRPAPIFRGSPCEERYP